MITKKLVEHWAREAGFCFDKYGLFHPDADDEGATDIDKELYAFAELVAAHGAEQAKAAMQGVKLEGMMLTSGTWTNVEFLPKFTHILTLESAQQAVAQERAMSERHIQEVDASRDRITELEAALRQCVDALENSQYDDSIRNYGMQSDAITKCKEMLK